MQVEQAAQAAVANAADSSEASQVLLDEAMQLRELVMRLSAMISGGEQHPAAATAEPAAAPAIPVQTAPVAFAAPPAPASRVWTSSAGTVSEPSAVTALLEQDEPSAGTVSLDDNGFRKTASGSKN